jgi:hypothetical protein
MDGLTDESTHSQKYFSSNVDKAMPNAIRGDKGLLKSMLNKLFFALPKIIVSNVGCCEEPYLLYSIYFSLNSESFS